MTRAAALALAVVALAGLALAQGEPRRWPLTVTERLALETLDARERAIAADREALARDVAARLGVRAEALRLDRKAGVWTEAVAPVGSPP